MDSEKSNRDAFRDVVIALLAIEVVALAWLVYEQSSGGRPAQANTVAFLTAATTVFISGRALLDRRTPSLRKGLEALHVTAVGAGLLSLAFVDFRSLGSAGFALPTVFVVALLLGYLRRRP